MNNSPKLYFLKNKDGKFYNSRQKAYFNSVINANYERDRKGLEMIIDLKFKDHEIHTITEEDFMREMASQTTNAVLAGEYFSKLLFQISFNLPTISQVNKMMYQKCKNAIEVLKPFSKLHGNFIEKEEDTTYEVQGHYGEFINEISKIELYETHEVVAILKAYKKDRSSILGITKKVLQ